MEIRVLIGAVFLTSSILYTCAPKSVPDGALEYPSISSGPSVDGQALVKSASGGWEMQWQKMLAEAKKERKLLLYATIETSVSIPLAEAFKEKTGITVEIVTGRGGELSQKILTENRAGLNLADIFLGGSQTIVTALKPSGMLEPLVTSLLLPEVKDPTMWLSKRLPFADKEEKYVLNVRAQVGGTSEILINTQFTSIEEINSYYDLLSPKWKERIVIQDPTTAGRGNLWFSTQLETKSLDEAFMRELVRQKPVISRDKRLMVEWVARGKYFINIAPGTETVEEFQRAGVPLLVSSVKGGAVYVNAGSGSVAMLAKPAHPNTAVIFLNWFLSKEGQTIFSKAYDAPSARLDVPISHLDPELIPKPDIKYLNTDSEEFLIKRSTYYDRLAKDIFGPLLKSN